MKAGIFAILFIFLVITLLTAGSIELTGEKNNLKINCDFEIEKITSKKIDNEDYDILSVSECVNTGIIGEAELPVYTKLVSLPETGNLKVTEIKYDVEEIDLEKKLIPFGWQDNENTENEFYLRDKWFPQDIVSISKPNIMRGNRFTQITVAAVQYNPF
ncbi:MAG: C25 family peptidase propeptide domain-containing protein, partial [Candidatus Cloacimonadales bacterium]|nr:C25 family peptidase propeptide domain-containing protein [Candidatus Cloacimonadales bacterium]